MTLNDMAIKYLKQARKLITNKSRWVQGVSAARKDGSGAPIDSPEAYRFCAIGAIYHVTSNLSINNANNVREEIDSVLLYVLPNGVNSIVALNDGTTPVGSKPRTGHAAVLRCFDRAIKHMEKNRKKKS